MWKAYVPETVMLYSKKHNGFCNAPVTSVLAHPVGKHPKGCPIVHSMVALEIRTDLGSVWYGVDKAYIDGSLRMVVERAENRDKVLAKWEPVGSGLLTYGGEHNCARCGQDVGHEDDFCDACHEYLQQDDPGALYAD